jgi:Ca2+/H+ antiporter, TMEM165/GDT1 family
MTWLITNATVIAVAFSASLVEAVEALTIVLAVMSVRGPRPALLGATSGLLSLGAMVLIFSPVLGRIPLRSLQLTVGVLLLLFGMRWLRKAILRAAGIIPLHDEMLAYATETAFLREQVLRHERRLDWLGAVASFKAVIIEGLEVVFIVTAVGSGRGSPAAAGFGAVAACATVLLLGLLIRRPLAQVPGNTLKFCVGVMLSAFGVFWTGEGMGIEWPGSDLAIIGFVLSFLAAGLVTVTLLRRRAVLRAAE